MMLCCVLAAPAGAADVFGDVVLGSAEAPPGWQLEEERRAEDVSAIPEATAALQQRWSYRGESFQIIYFGCRDLAQASTLYTRHTLALGREAILAPLGTVVVELHGAPREVWADAGALLGFDGAQTRKVVAAALPAGWTVAEEFLASAREVAEAGAALGAPVQAVLTQVVETPHGDVRVNYLLCANRPSAAEVYERSWSVQRPNTFVTLDGPVVVEIMAEDEEALLPALEVIEAAPLLLRPTTP